MSWIHYTHRNNYSHQPCMKNYKNVSDEFVIKSSWEHREFIQKNASEIMFHNTSIPVKNAVNVQNRGYSMNTLAPSNLKRNFLENQQNILNGSIIPFILP